MTTCPSVDNPIQLSQNDNFKRASFDLNCTGSAAAFGLETFDLILDTVNVLNPPGVNFALLANLDSIFFAMHNSTGTAFVLVPGVFTGGTVSVNTILSDSTSVFGISTSLTFLTLIKVTSLQP